VKHEQHRRQPQGTTAQQAPESSSHLLWRRIEAYQSESKLSALTRWRKVKKKKRKKKKSVY
jgi:hypothetical protein